MAFKQIAPRQSWLAVAGVTTAAAGFGAYRLWQSIRSMRPDMQTTPLNPWASDLHKRVRMFEGGFEEKMTRREAALILGCRESSTKERIMTRYRQLMKMNHPDLGGSPFLSSKINEAKDQLVRTARSEEATKRMDRDDEDD